MFGWRQWLFAASLLGECIATRGLFFSRPRKKDATGSDESAITYRDQAIIGFVRRGCDAADC